MHDALLPRWGPTVLGISLPQLTRRMAACLVLRELKTDAFSECAEKLLIARISCQRPLII